MTEFYICEVCGGTDYDNEAIKICTKCCITKEHSWCMRDRLEEYKPWVCEECREKEEVMQDPTSLPSRPQNKVVLGELTTAGLSRSRYPVKRYVRPSKVKPLTEEEVKKLSSGAEIVRTSKTTIISRPRQMSLKHPNVPVKVNPRIPSGLAKYGRGGGRNIYLNFSPSATKKSEGVDTSTNNVVKMKKPLVASSTPVEYQNVGIEALNTNAEKTMIRSQTSLTLVGRSQQSDQVVRVNDLQSGEQETKNGEQETKKASGTPLTSIQKQNQLIKGSTSCASLASMNLDVEDIATLVQKLRFYESYFPAKCASWTGRCRILDHAGGGKFQLSSRVREAYGLSLELPVELQAHPAAVINCKAYELSLKMAAEHEVELLPRSDIWTLLFNDDSPDLRDIALYIFATAGTKSSEDNYAKLLECIEAEDLVIRTDVDGFELLVFSSKHLHTDIQDVICHWSRKRFFWGVFQQAKAVIQVALSVPDYGGFDHDHSNITDYEDVEMEIDMEGGREIGPPDIVVKKNHDDHSSFHDQEEVAMEIDMEGGREIGPPDIVVKKNHDDHSSFHDQEEVAMEIDMEGGNDLDPPEIAVWNYCSRTVVQSDDGKTADRTPSKVSMATTMHNESENKTLDRVKEPILPSKKCKLEPAEPNQKDVQGLINVKVERQEPEGPVSLLWTPPRADWVKLNVAVSTSSEATRAAGIIRDRAAKWLVGYNLNLGRSESLEAEFQALHEGLKLAWDGGFRKIVVELESSAAVEILRKETYSHDQNIGLVSRCKERIRSRWECKLQVSSKEGNLSADVLAQPFLCKPSGLNLLKDPPCELNHFLQIDARNAT